MKAVGKITELGDALDCAYGALPTKVQDAARRARRGKNPTAPVKAQMVYAHWQDIDLWKFSKCMVENEIKDRAIALANKPGQKLARDTGRLTGYGLSRTGQTDFSTQGAREMQDGRVLPKQKQADDYNSKWTARRIFGSGFST